MPNDPDVILLCWAFWVHSDLILIYHWGGLCLAAPTGSGSCSAVHCPLRASNAIVHSQRNKWVGNTVTCPVRLNLGVHMFGTDLENGDLVGRTKNKRLVIFLY